MLVYCNPDKKKLAKLYAASKYNAVKLIKDLDTGDTYYWPASDIPHKRMAKTLQVKHYEKGIAVPE